MPWIADHGYADDTFATPYVDTFVTLATASGYTSDINYNQNLDYIFTTNANAGSSAKYFCDQQFVNTDNRRSRFGGRWNDGTTAGIFARALGSETGSYEISIGARLAYVPQVA